MTINNSESVYKMNVIKFILKGILYLLVTLAIVFVVCAVMIIGDDLGMPL